VDKTQKGEFYTNLLWMNMKFMLVGIKCGHKQ